MLASLTPVALSMLRLCPWLVLAGSVPTVLSWASRRDRLGRTPTARPYPTPAVPAALPPWASVLEVKLPVTAEQVRRAHRRLSKRHHPDVGGAKVAMQQLNEARRQGLAWTQGHLLT